MPPSTTPHTQNRTSLPASLPGSEASQNTTAAIPRVERLINNDAYIGTANFQGKSMRGVFARRKIIIGTRILISDALMTVSNLDVYEEDWLYNNIHEYSANDKAQIESRYKSLELGKKHKFDELYGGIGKTGRARILDKFNLNSFGYWSAGRASSILFYNISFVNHSCQPNVLAEWNSNIQQGTLHATRDIKQGEQLLVDYNALNYHWTRRQRRIYLKNSWGFDCDCELCRDLTNSRDSDKRRRKINELHTTLFDTTGSRENEGYRVKKKIGTVKRHRTSDERRWESLISMMCDEGLKDANSLLDVVEGAHEYYAHQSKDIQLAYEYVRAAHIIALTCYGADHPRTIADKAKLEAMEKGWGMLDIPSGEVSTSDSGS